VVVEEGVSAGARRVENVWWIAGAAIAAWACARVAPSATPVDASLPLVALVVMFVAWLVRSTPAAVAVECAVPLLVGCAIAIEEERVRLVAYGLIVGAAFAAALIVRCTRFEALGMTAAAIVLLRWIPIVDVGFTRELLLMACALAIVAAARDVSPLTVFVAVAAALFTPVMPLRTLAIPLALALLLRFVRFRSQVVAAAGVALLLLFFAYSGVVARGMPYLWRWEPGHERTLIGRTLSPGESIDLDVPSDAQWLVLSGAKASRLRRGTVLAHVNGAPVRIGDVADWGFMRRPHWWNARNVLPRRPAGSIHGYGYAAWVDGAGRIALPRGVRRIRVGADARLPAGVVLQVEVFER
jgi:hypothetical protein